MEKDSRIYCDHCGEYRHEGHISGYCTECSYLIMSEEDDDDDQSGGD